jgi:phage tail-like protein
VTPATHFLLDRRAGWRAEPALVDAVEWSDGALRLAPLPGAPQPVTDASGSFGGLVDPIGVATGPDGTLVILDRAGDRALRYDPCASAFAPLTCILAPGSDFALRGARDLTVTNRGDVAIADTGNRRVLVLFGSGLAIRGVAGPWAYADGLVAPGSPLCSVSAAGGCPIVLTWPADVWEPWGIASTHHGLVVTDHAGGLVHFLDGCGRWLHASDGSGPGVGPLAAPTAVAVDRSGEVYVLQDGIATVRVLDSDGKFVADLATLDPRRHDFCPVAVALAPDGSLCVAGAGGELCVLAPASGGGFAPALTTAIDSPVAGLAFDHDGQPVLIDADQCCLVRLRNAAGYPKRGRFVTAALDSALTGCQWHRVALSASLPEGTQVRVDTLTAESPMSAAELSIQPSSRWATGQLVGTVEDGHWDCLIRSDAGRYAWLALTLSSDGAVTPEIEDVEVWFPRSTSARKLPKAYAIEPAGGDFLERFMAIADSQRDSVVAEIDRIAALLDPMAAPASGDGTPDFLGWLAGWVGMAIDEQLPVARRRELVRDAAALYRLRGTPEGVRRFVSLFCGVQVRVLEHYRLRRWAIAGRARLGDTSTLFGPEIVRRLQLDDFSEIGQFELIDTDDPRRDPFFVYASRFTLFLLATADDRLLALAQRVTELAKPAHTLVDIATVEPRQRVGIQSTIGLNTVVGGVPAPGRTGEARLGQGLIVGPDPRLGGRTAAQIGMRSQIGVNTCLN